MTENKKRFNLDDDQSKSEGNAPAPEQSQKSAPAQGEEYDEDYYHDPSHSTPDKYREDTSKLIEYLKYPENKRALAEFLTQTYKEVEKESIERVINRAIYEHKCELEGAKPHHKPGHIGPLMYEYLNMCGVENAFVSGLQHTKSSMTKTIQQRVDEINTLLRGVGGFNRQIKASLSRSAVVYLEQEDARNPHRERVIFTVNLSDHELSHPLNEESGTMETEDGRTLQRYSWDFAVNNLSEIVSNTGMKPKYVKNDKNALDFTMSQYLLCEGEEAPDEYFSFSMRYVNDQAKEKMIQEYTRKIAEFDKKINDLRKKEKGLLVNRKNRDFFKEQADFLEADREFFIGTHPDPREVDTGILFSIHANTMKDYNITKDKMQVIMTKFILSLSNIAVDKSMDEQLNTEYSAKAREYGDAPKRKETRAQGKSRRVIMKDDLKKPKAS
ncbi:hypothetical protein [Oligoflexus tunisiensis]|uniref:hypothetical protein n=1 Tax=Oligoflexus tunisiensis TaxID=708132 RepID=UPI00114CF3BF|nr:hypothetical protein [Oligoflexus tunisiensis]